MKKAAICFLFQLLACHLYCQCGNGEIVRLNSQTKVNSFIADYCTGFKTTQFNKRQAEMIN